MKKYQLVPVAIAALVLSGCASKQTTLYHWDNYEPQVYNYFKGEAPDAQILILEKQLGEANDKKLVVPPGFYAHLGLLYEKVGRSNDMLAMLDKEKKLYPESSVYIDNILNGFKGLK